MYPQQEWGDTKHNRSLATLENRLKRRAKKANIEGDSLDSQAFMMKVFHDQLSRYIGYT